MPAAQDPVARGEPALPARARRAGSCAARGRRAGSAARARVVAVAEVVGAPLVVAERGVGAVGAQGERAAVAPAPDELGRDELLVELQPPGLLGELGAEAGDVLVQLAPHHVARVAIEGRGRRRRRAAVLVLVAQDELARLDRAPPRAAQRPPRRRACTAIPWPRTSSRATPSMAGCEKPSVKPKCSRCSPSSAGRLRVGELEPAVLRAQRALPAPRLGLERVGALGVHDDEDLEVAQLVAPTCRGRRRGARRAPPCPSRSSAGKPSRIHAGSSSAASAR